MLSVMDLSQKESFPGSEFKPASIWTCWMQIDRQTQSGVHAGTSQVDFEVDCPPPARSTRRSFDHHGKGNGNFVSKRVSKNEKKVVPLIDLKEMKTRNN